MTVLSRFEGEPGASGAHRRGRACSRKRRFHQDDHRRPWRSRHCRPHQLLFTARNSALGLCPCAEFVQCSRVGPGPSCNFTRAAYDAGRFVCRSCDSRKYTYFFPSYLLIPPKPGSGLYQTLDSLPPSSSASDAAPVELPTSHPFWSEPAHADSTKEDDLIRKRKWRVGSEMVEKLREIAKKFEASHNFHNFTVGRDFSDRSTQRHMKKIEVCALSPIFL